VLRKKQDPVDDFGVKTRNPKDSLDIDNAAVAIRNLGHTKPY